MADGIGVGGDIYSDGNGCRLPKEISARFDLNFPIEILWNGKSIFGEFSFSFRFSFLLALLTRPTEGNLMVFSPFTRCPGICEWNELATHARRYCWRGWIYWIQQYIQLVWASTDGASVWLVAYGVNKIVKTDCKHSKEKKKNRKTLDRRHALCRVRRRQVSKAQMNLFFVSMLLNFSICRDNHSAKSNNTRATYCTNFVGSTSSSSPLLLKSVVDFLVVFCIPAHSNRNIRI